MVDPLVQWKRRTAGSVVIGTMLLIPGVVLLIRNPSPVARQPVILDPIPPTITSAPRPVVDEAAFNLDLWPVPPQPIATVKNSPPPLPPVPPQVQLVGIVQTDGERVAAVFDQSVDRVIELRTGDVIQNFQVVLIDNQGITLQDGAVRHRLLLRGDEK